MTDSSIPSADTIDTSWLTARLNENGHKNARVLAFESQQIGTGQIGKCIRYTLEVDGDASAPRSLVGKFPADNDLSRATGVALRNFIKEVRFYQTLQSRLSIRTPRCYYADIEGEGPEFILLLEDLAPAEQGDQLSGCDETTADAAVLELVGLHAPSWCDQSLRAFDWLGENTNDSRDMLINLYQAQLPGFKDRFGERLAPEEMDIIERLGQSSNVLGRSSGEPFSLIHIDYRLDNLLIDSSISPPRVTTVDWQSITLGNPMTDVAYFLGAGLLPETRRAVEERIVRDYHQAMTGAGVSDYDWADCWRDYRRAAFAGFSVTVIASMLVQQTTRGDEMFTVMAQRHSRHALDLDAGEFL